MLPEFEELQRIQRFTFRMEMKSIIRLQDAEDSTKAEIKALGLMLGYHESRKKKKGYAT